MIDGFFHKEIFLTGKKCSKQQLRQLYFEARKFTYEETDFSNVFCRLHKFDRIPFSKGIKADFILDTDTDRVYSPSY
ncbi:hypothetical protein C1N73_28200 (plasmid) [Priestia aryabhattai]